MHNLNFHPNPIVIKNAIHIFLKLNRGHRQSSGREATAVYLESARILLYNLLDVGERRGRAARRQG